MSLKPLPQNLLSPLPALNLGNPLRAATAQSATGPGLPGDAAAPAGDGAPTEFSRLLERQRLKGVATTLRAPAPPSPATPGVASSTPARTPTAAVSTAASASPMRPTTSPSTASTTARNPASNASVADKEARTRAARARDDDDASTTETRRAGVDTARGDAPSTDASTDALAPQNPVRSDDTLVATASTAAGLPMPNGPGLAAAVVPGGEPGVSQKGDAAATSELEQRLGSATAPAGDSAELADELDSDATGAGSASMTAASGDLRQTNARAPSAREERLAADAELSAVRLAAIDPGSSADRAVEGALWLAQATRQGAGEGVATSSSRHGAAPLDVASPIGVGGTGQALGGAMAVDTAVPLASYLSTPFDDPGFRDALGAQVSLLARDGVHSAELRLNPADMGPVSVQITMNGDQATVDFGADRAQTRQAIEAGWAELAASLRESGFTLSGGGVSSRHARDRTDSGRDGAGRTTGDRVGDALADDTSGDSVTVLRGRPRAGAALDLYA